MTILLGVLALCALMGVAALAVIVLRQNSSRPKQDMHTQIILDMQQQMIDLKSVLKDQGVEVTRQINEQLRQNTELMRETHHGYRDAVGKLENRMGQLQEATHAMMAIGKDIASLQDILRAPKLRGGFGEFLLGELLRQILPEDHFSLQYSFRNGTQVDAVIKLGQGIIPVDAKFPLENFKRIQQAQDEAGQKSAKKGFVQDVKKHVDAISDKYILPEEGTFDFALMYIPAENVYYETIIKDEAQTDGLVEYAMKRRVIPVSPNSFYAYLQAIVHGLRGLRIERSAQVILQSLGQLETDFKKCFTEFEKVGSHVGNAQTAFDRTRRQFEKLQDKLTAIESHQERPLIAENQE
ncbi:MAG: DNA recombination protein RmuC [Candidatus Omnitrophota bacterium]|nr:DNA recombination protein RmuC [Candidatus Omnitrophota bacterium]